MGSFYLFNGYTDFYQIWSYDVGPIPRPYLEGGHYWSMWAWLITTNPNLHTFSLLHFQCTSHYSKYLGSDVGLCLHFAPSLSSFGPTSVGSAVRGVWVELLAVLVYFIIIYFLWKQNLFQKSVGHMTWKLLGKNHNFCTLVMCNTTDFVPDPILSKIQAGIGNTDPIPILCANTPNVTGKCKKCSVFRIITS